MRQIGPRAGALDFIEFGLDRNLPRWVYPIMDKPYIHLAPGNQKEVVGARVLELPEWNGDFDDIPFPDNSVGGIFTTHFLEHLVDPRRCISECGRVLAPGAPLTIIVPHAEALIYKQDLDHKTPFVIETWKTLLNNPYYASDAGFHMEFRIGFNATFAVAERNTVLVTQLIKEG